MPSLFYGKSAYRRDNGNLPELRLVNMLAETTPAAEDGVVITSRPGLVEQSTVGSGPINGIFAQAGVFSGDRLIISDATLYRNTTSLGAIAGTGPARFAASALEAVVTRGGAMRRTDGAAISTPTFPDSASVTAVAFLAGYFVAVRAGGHRFYWSAVLDATSWDALDFASAESAPDGLLDIVAVGDELWMFGEESVEVWVPSGVADTPFVRVEARLYRKGARDTGCAVELDNTAFWVGNDNIAYRGGDRPERISDHGIEERIGQSSTVSCFSYIFEGHAMFAVRLAVGTWLYDAATQQWCEFNSDGRDNWRAACAATSGDVVYLGDDTSGQVYTFDTSIFTEDDDTMERLFTAAMPLKGGVFIADVITLEANVGWTSDLAGQGSDPIVEMRTSRNAGATHGAWRQGRMGQQGQYRKRPTWNRCGMFDAPGLMAEFRCTDPVPFRVSGVFVNEARGGRAR